MNNSEAIDSAVSLFVVYDSPRDYPTRYVIREHFVSSDGTYGVSQEAFLFPNLDLAREWLDERGFMQLPNDPAEDDPAIVEVWMA